MAIPPTVSALDPLSRNFSFSRNPFPGSVYIVVADPLVRQHPTGIIKIVPRSVNQFPVISCVASVSMAIPPAISALDPSDQIFRFSLIPNTGTIHIINTDPLICSHITINWIQIIPRSINQLPTGLHRSIICSAKIIPFSITEEPAGTHITALIKSIPFPVDDFPLAHRIRSIIFLPPPAGLVLLPRRCLYADRSK